MTHPARRTVLPLAALGLGLALAAAAPGPASPPAAAPALASPAAQTWRVDGVHSSVVFRIRHMSACNFYGVFKDVTGRIVLDQEDASNNAVEFTVLAESVDTRNAKRDQHVTSPDFLNAKEFPEITFRSTKVAPAGENGWTLEGELTLHGVTRTISAEAEKTGEGEGRGGSRLAGFECRFEVKRSDFGMDNMVGPLSDEVGVVVSVETQLEG